MKRIYEKPMACIEAFSLSAAVTIEATSKISTDDALVRGAFDHDNETEEGENSWSDVW